MARHSAAEFGAGAAVILVAAGFLGYAVANVGPSMSGGDYTLRASFDHADGISSGSEVRIAGVRVGSVEAIRLDPKTFLADVSFSVARDVKLSTDSSATVATDGLLGGKYLQLAAGGDAKMLAPGDEITITQGSVNLEALLGKYIFGSTGGGSAAKPDGAAAPAKGDGLAPLK